MRRRLEPRRFTTVFFLGLALVLLVMYMSLATGIIQLTHLETIRTLFGLN